MSQRQEMSRLQEETLGQVFARTKPQARNILNNDKSNTDGNAAAAASSIVNNSNNIELISPSPEPPAGQALHHGHSHSSSSRKFKTADPTLNNDQDYWALLPIVFILAASLITFYYNFSLYFITPPINEDSQFIYWTFDRTLPPAQYIYAIRTFSSDIEGLNALRNEQRNCDSIPFNEYWPFFGRKSELKQLQLTFQSHSQLIYSHSNYAHTHSTNSHQLQANVPLAIIAGPAGIGKRRFINQFFFKLKTNQLTSNPIHPYNLILHLNAASTQSLMADLVHLHATLGFQALAPFHPLILDNLRSFLAKQRRYLVVFHNVQLPRAELERFLPKNFLVTAEIIWLIDVESKDKAEDYISQVTRYEINQTNRHKLIFLGNLPRKYSISLIKAVSNIQNSTIVDQIHRNLADFFQNNTELTKSFSYFFKRHSSQGGNITKITSELQKLAENAPIEKNFLFLSWLSEQITLPFGFNLLEIMQGASFLTHNSSNSVPSALFSQFLAELLGEGSGKVAESAIFTQVTRRLIELGLLHDCGAYSNGFLRGLQPLTAQMSSLQCICVPHAMVKDLFVHDSSGKVARKVLAALNYVTNPHNTANFLSIVPSPLHSAYFQGYLANSTAAPALTPVDLGFPYNFPLPTAAGNEFLARITVENYRNNWFIVYSAAVQATLVNILPLLSKNSNNNALSSTRNLSNAAVIYALDIGQSFEAAKAIAAQDQRTEALVSNLEQLHNPRTNCLQSPESSQTCSKIRRIVQQVQAEDVSDAVHDALAQESKITRREIADALLYALKQHLKGNSVDSAQDLFAVYTAVESSLDNSPLANATLTVLHGQLQFSLGKYEQSQQIFQSALAKLQALLSANDLRQAIVRHYISVAQYYSQQYSSVENQIAINSVVTSASQYHPFLLYLYNWQSAIYYAKDSYEMCLSANKISYDVATKILSDHSALSSIFKNRAIELYNKIEALNEERRRAAAARAELERKQRESKDSEL
jgi:hypothetical protein